MANTTKPEIKISIQTSRYGSAQPTVRFFWRDAPMTHGSNGLLMATVYRTVADAMITAAAQKFDLCAPEIYGLMNEGRNAVSCTITFETMGGTDREAKIVDEILHDAIPAAK